MLSDIDIKNELIAEEPNIMVYPLQTRNIKGSSINLTADSYAWKVSDNNSAVNSDLIVIPPQDTVCIQTKESIWVSRRIAGTFHSKVSLVTNGLGHVSTTLDPQWLGSCLIAINNPTEYEKEIKIGTTFITLVLHKLDSPSTKGKNENAPSRPDLRLKFNLTEEEKEHFNEEVYRSYEGLRASLAKSDDFQNLLNEKKELKEEQAEKERDLKNNLIYPLFVSFIGGESVKYFV